VAAHELQSAASIPIAPVVIGIGAISVGPIIVIGAVIAVIIIGVVTVAWIIAVIAVARIIAIMPPVIRSLLYE